MESSKPGASPEKIYVRIAGLMSVPRLGFTDFQHCSQIAARQIGIPVHMYRGVFWEHRIQAGMEALIKEGVEWILCLDYDTLFTVAQLNELIRRFASNPHIDALAAMQVMRGAPEPVMLGAPRDNSGSFGDDEIRKMTIEENSILNAKAAHFGLTLIRAEAIKRMPKPWFHGIPNEHGEWDDGRTDPDIFFWRNFAECGGTIAIDTSIRVGHLELMAVDYSPDYKIRITQAHEWIERAMKEHDSHADKNNARSQPVAQGI